MFLLNQCEAIIQMSSNDDEKNFDIFFKERNTDGSSSSLNSFGGKSCNSGSKVFTKPIFTHIKLDILDQ